MALPLGKIWKFAGTAMPKPTDSAARRLKAWRNAAALLVACTCLYEPAIAFAQSTQATPVLKRRTDSRVATALQQNQAEVEAEATGVDPAAANPADPTTLTTQGIAPPVNAGDAITDEPDEANAPYEQQLNSYEPTIDGGDVDPTAATNLTPGIRLGTMVLRPTISQTLNTEKQKSSGSSDRRNYMTTGIRGTLNSDWSRHSLTVTGDGAWERNFGSDKSGEEPRASINADLQLDLAKDTTVNIPGGYNFSREDTDDPNALNNASVQSGVHEFTGGVAVARDLGRIRGLAAIELQRNVYSAAKALDGSSIDLSARDRTGGDIRVRAGYELSPALIPFLEVSSGLTRYDDKFDDTGYERSSKSYGAKLGTELDLGEKLRGELALGYLRKSYDDQRLGSINAFSVDGDLAWSPQRGTDVSLGLRTTIEDFAGGSQGGWISHRLTAGLTHQLRNNLVARLTGQVTRRNFPSGDTRDVTEYFTSAGLTWSLNRYLDLTSDISYQTTPAYDTGTWRIGAGIAFKR
jgi:hypothetical protein